MTLVGEDTYREDFTDVILIMLMDSQRRENSRRSEKVKEVEIVKEMKIVKAVKIVKEVKRSDGL